MALEKSLWAWLAKGRVELGRALDMERVENLLGAGTPDVEGFYCLGCICPPEMRSTMRRVLGCEHCRAIRDGLPSASAFQLELKAAERPARTSTPVRFKLRGRDKQIEHMRRRWELGANAFFLLQVGSASERRLYLAPGSLGPSLLKGMTEAELAVSCLTTGVWSGLKISHVDLFKRVIQCRVRSSLFPN